MSASLLVDPSDSVRALFAAVLVISVVAGAAVKTIIFRYLRFVGEENGRAREMGRIQIRFAIRLICPTCPSN